MYQVKNDDDGEKFTFDNSDVKTTFKFDDKREKEVEKARASLDIREAKPKEKGTYLVVAAIVIVFALAFLLFR